MATRRRRSNGDGDDKGPSKDDYPPPDGEEPRGPGNPDADPVRIHEEFVRRRLGGGAAATPEKYGRAIEQWSELPGAVRVPPAVSSEEDAQQASDESDDDSDGRSS